MNELEQRLDYPWGDALPTEGGFIEVAPGVRWIRMGLPFALDHINLWLLRDTFEGRDGWTAVDCCVDSPEARAMWQQVFDRALDGLPIVRVLATHVHPDHLGLAHWLCERWQAPLWMSATDYYVARFMTHGPGFDSADNATFCASHGLSDPASLEAIRTRGGLYRTLVPDVPRSFHRLMDDAAVLIGGNPWRCIAGYGHAPEHMALYSPAVNVLIGGDMMLPRISTNISVPAWEPDANALGLFLESIDRFSFLPSDTLALPSHGKPFRGLHERIAQLAGHHDERLGALLQACTAKPMTAFEAFPLLFRRPIDPEHVGLAMGEAVAHFVYLVEAGKAVRQRGEDGIYRFSAIRTG